MKKLITVIGIIFFTGCASMPVIGPCSYMAAKSNEPRPGTAAGNESFSESLWKATKATLGYAGDTALWSLAAQAVDDKLNDSDKDSKLMFPAIGNNNIIIVEEGDGSIRYQPVSTRY